MEPIRESALSLAFMRGHPASAARVLEGQSAEQAALVFERAPARIGAGVMAAMLPRQASNCLSSLNDARALELLAAMPMQATVSLLRNLPASRRRALIAGLPTASALASTILLGYSEDALGAWADPEVLMLPAASRAGDAVERIRHTDSVQPSIYVTDSARALSGVVDLTTLLRAPQASTLASLMHPPPALLMAHAPLAGSAEDPGWALASVLPVVEPGDRLVGVLTRHALARALRRHLEQPAQAAAAGTLPAVLAKGYWQTLCGVLGVGVGLLPGVGPVDGAPDEH
jgi:magnesium transporter